MLLKLTRIHPLADCRIGVLEDGHGFQLMTLELPAYGDGRGPYSVPDGDYDLIPYDSPDHGETWCLHNPELGIYAGAAAGYPKPDRQGVHDYVELHVGNWPHDSKGCILVGMDWQGDSMIYRSAEAMDRLRKHLGPMTAGHRLSISHRHD